MEEIKHIVQARSKRNGIIFYSNTFPLIGSETFVNGNNEIQERLVLVDFEEYADYLGMLNEKAPTLDKRKIIIFDVLLIGIGLLLKSFWVTFAAVYFSILVSVDFFHFINGILRSKYKNENNFSISKFHAAEHMAINAYEKLQRIPTLEEIKHFSRFSKNCGSCNVIRKICYYTLISLAMVFLASWNTLLYILILICIIILYVMDIKIGWLRFLQISVTSKPSDVELKLAIEGLKNFEKMEQRLKSGDSEIFLEVELPGNIPFFPFPFLF